MSITHKPKAGAKLTGTEYEAADAHVVSLTAADVGAQPLDSDLTAIAALSTTAFGRGLLILADAAALLSASGGAASVHTHAGGDITSGTVADGVIASTIARDSEVTTAVTNHEAAADPHPVYLTAAEGTAAYDAIGAAAAAQAASQPLDSDLTAIAALATTSFGRSLLTAADATALRTTSGDLASADYRTPIEDPTFELSGGNRMTLGGSSELFWATNDRQFRMSAAYAQSITVPNGYWRLHYRELQLTAANRLNCSGTSDFVLTDLGAPAGRLTLAGRF